MKGDNEIRIEKPKYLPITKKALIFDSGAVISFSMNGITSILRDLKKSFRGKFLIPLAVKSELIDVPITIKRFELEALKVKKLLDDGIFELPSAVDVKDSEVHQLDKKMMDTANSTFSANGRDIHLVDHGEASCLALSSILAGRGVDSVIAIDERTTRLLAEKPENLRRILEDRFHTNVRVNQENLKMFSKFKMIRSTELAYVAYKKGLIDLKDGNRVLDAILYSLKFKGAAISGEEIEEIKSLG